MIDLEREKYRRELYSDKISDQRARIIGSHKLCKGSGFVEKIQVFSEDDIPRRVVEPCSCRKKFELVSRFVLSNIPFAVVLNQQIYPKIVMDSVSNSSMDIVPEIIKPLVRNLSKFSKLPFGLVFLGKNGTGKTFVGLKILYYAVIFGLTAHYIEFQDFLKLSRKTFDFNDSLSENVLAEIIDSDILLVDELGSESKRSEYGVSELKSCIKKRVNNKKPTILISNYSYEELKKVYGVSIDNMISSSSRVLDFSSSLDVRKAKGSVDMADFYKSIKKGHVRK